MIYRVLVLFMAGFLTAFAAEEKPPAKPENTASQERDKEKEKEKEKAPDKEKPKDEKDKEKKGKDSEEKMVETSHTVRIGGEEIRYKASAGTIVLHDNEDKPTASIFYIAYTREGVSKLADRPITFSFNGGPGSSSVWMHLGMLGPRRVKLAEDGGALPPPYSLIDNEFSILDETDLVFVDPVSTGYSRAIPAKEANKFHGLHEDTASVGEFIRLYVTRHERWASPKFVIGESYGTTRAAALSGELHDHLHMHLNGIMLVSTVLNFETLSFAPGNDLPYVLFFPSYATTAWFHKKLSPELQQRSLSEVFDLATTFSLGQYNSALLAGSSLTDDARAKTLQDYARFTGLSTNYIDRADLRVPLSRFAAELLADEKKVIGRYDSRYKGYVRDRISEHMEQDPSFEAVASAFASTFNHYVRTELKYETDLTYEILTSVQPWNWDQANAYVNVGETLAGALTKNPFLKIHVSSGYYDMATPLLATRYTFDHLKVDPALQKNITLDSYEAGHMMYLNLPDLKKSKTDLARFIKSATKS